MRFSCNFLFTFNNERILIGLCGDIWYDNNIDRINELKPSLIFWPVYVDYNYKEWNEVIKYEYLEQANKINSSVLLVNSYCLDKDNDSIAKGGALYIDNKKIIKEIPAGRKDVLIVNKE